MDNHFEFARCQKPSGKFYGTRFKCKPPSVEVAPKEERTSSRVRVGKSVKNLGPEELEKLLKDTRVKPHQAKKIQDLIDSKKAKEDPEKDAIDQLLAMLPRGEKVMDSSGNTRSLRKKANPNTEETLEKVSTKRATVEKALNDEQRRLRMMSEDKKFATLRGKREDRIQKLNETYDKLNNRYMDINKALDAEAQRSGIPRPLILPTWSTSLGTLNLPKITP
jgi:hypothetical protein